MQNCTFLALIRGPLQVAEESIERFIEDQAFPLKYVLAHPPVTHRKTEKERQVADWGRRSQII
jgi:hypothetical protein